MTNTAIDVRCPACGFSPVESAILEPKTIDDIIRHPVCLTREDVMDCYEVGGADEDNVICPECSWEFDPGEPPAAESAIDPNQR